MKTSCPMPVRRFGRTLARVGQVAAPPAVTAPNPAGDDRPRRARRPRWLWALAAAVALLAIAATVVLLQPPSTPAVTRADVARAVQQGLDKAAKDARNAPPDASVAYQKALPSMVAIMTTRSDGTGSGAGVVISDDGSVLTALHVVEEASTITVRFSDGTESPAGIARQEKSVDIAVLTPERLPEVVVPAVIGGGAKVGDAVFALGHPLGLTNSLSAGVVSALDRSIHVTSDQTLKGLIQFDAAVNPGNSGGPLLNRDGLVVGIVTGLANPSEQSFFVGIGFAVPIATAGGVAGSPPQ
jgi:S1-C subfamily serine protease